MVSRSSDATLKRVKSGAGEKLRDSDWVYLSNTLGKWSHATLMGISEKDAG